LPLAQGRYSEAETCHLNLLKHKCKTWSSKETLGVNHLDLISHLRRLGQLYNRAESYIRAHQILALVRKAYSKLLGPTNWFTLDAALWECYNSSFIGPKENALTNCMRAKEELEAMFHPTHEDIIFGNLTLARLYLQNSKYAQAEVSVLQAVSAAIQLLGPKSDLVIRTKDVLGAALAAQGKLTEAEKELLGALSTAEEALGRLRPVTVKIKGELGKTYEKLGRDEEAMALKMQVEEEKGFWSRIGR
jgi:hypothetical protein